MSDLNHIFIGGFLIEDAVFTRAENRDWTAQFPVYQRRVWVKDGAPIEETLFFTVFHETTVPQKLRPILKKGSRVLLYGSLKDGRDGMCVYAKSITPLRGGNAEEAR